MQHTHSRKLPPLSESGSRLSYTTAEVAAMHGVSTKTVYRWIVRGLLPTSKASRKLLIPARAVENFMEVTI
jgi:excisionase family DNA binding protein